MIAQGETGLPIFIGVMKFAVAAAVEAFPELAPGDIVALNDPYLGGTHLMDTKLVKPFFYRGKLFCYLANTGHWVDVGGSVPGGFNSKATEIFQEGLRIPPIRLFREGKLDRDLLELDFLTNMRLPEERMGDLQAQAQASMWASGGLPSSSTNTAQTPFRPISASFRGVRKSRCAAR